MIKGWWNRTEQTQWQPSCCERQTKREFQPLTKWHNLRGGRISVVFAPHMGAVGSWVFSLTAWGTRSQVARFICCSAEGVLGELGVPWREEERECTVEDKEGSRGRWEVDKPGEKRHRQTDRQTDSIESESNTGSKRTREGRKERLQFPALSDRRSSPETSYLQGASLTW